MARLFPNCQYGPVHLRGLLRAALDPGERLVGWGVVQRNVSFTTVTLAVAFNLLPVFGTLASAMLIGSQRHLAVLTDRRLLLLDCTKKACLPSGRGIYLEAGIESLHVVRRSHARRFLLEFSGARPRMTVMVPDARQRSTRRLLEGLALLAADAPGEAGAGVIAAPSAGV